MDSVIRPGAWVALKLPSGITRVVQISPNTTISLGKYGSFPANFILDRPYHLTFEILDRQAGESFSRLRVVPTDELYAEVFADEESPECAAPTPNAGDATPAEQAAATETTNGQDSATTTEAKLLDESARQTLTQDEIEELKKGVTDAGRAVIMKLIESHAAIDQKTSFSLAKYRLLKTKKYIRRFQVLPVDVPTFAQWQLEERDASKILDMRAEMVGLVGCWANVHHGGEAVYLEDPMASCDQGAEAYAPLKPELLKGRWLVVDDTCGALTAAMAERMGLLYEQEEDDEEEENQEGIPTRERQGTKETDASAAATTEAVPKPKATKPPRASDFAIPYSQTNTITVLHGASQANLSFLTYWGLDITSPNHPPHPLLNHLLTLTWLQLLKPELDTTYSTPPLTATPEVLANWKATRRGNFHRKRRRSARVRHIVDATRSGNFSGLVSASTMNPISILKHTLPLLAGGATVAIYSPTIESLAELADCFSVVRRTAWTSGQVPGTGGKSAAELERWPGTPDFPLNPTLLLGTSIQTSRARRWQVLPGRTHPLMTERGGSEGYVFTAFRAKPAEGHVEAMGKYGGGGKRKKTASAADVSGDVAKEAVASNEVEEVEMADARPAATVGNSE